LDEFVDVGRVQQKAFVGRRAEGAQIAAINGQAQ